MESSRRDFLQSAPLALIGIPLATQEKQITHKFKLGQKLIVNGLSGKELYSITCLIKREMKDGVELSYKIKPDKNDYDFEIDEKHLLEEKWLTIVK